MNIREILSRFMRNGNKRDLWSIFDYPQSVVVEDYWRRYRRDGIGSRIIRAYPDACWRGKPIVQDEAGSSPNPDSDEFSPFTQAWEDLSDRTRALTYLTRADRLGRVGHFSILLLGFEGGDDLSNSVSGAARLAYLAAYSERSVNISSFDADPTSPRFGLPLIYSITLKSDEGTTSRNRRSAIQVHYSRVIHVAENTDEDDVFGEPALRPIWNYLLDLEKLVGSGAEAFWLNARGALSVEVEGDANLTPESLTDMKGQIEDFTNELRRTIAVQGAKVVPLTMQISDPSPNVNILLQLISGATGIPQRMLTGSERGELASSEDANSWESRIDERRQDHVNPVILLPFITRMIETGNLPEPTGNWEAKWQEASAMSPDKQADIALKRATAASTWANGMADRVIAREEFREMLGLEPDSEYELEDLPEGEGDDDDFDPFATDDDDGGGDGPGDAG